jgi:hypothetical protein
MQWFIVKSLDENFHTSRKSRIIPIQKAERRGNVEELCDKSIYEMSHCIHFENWERRKSRSWISQVWIILFFTSPTHTEVREVVSQNLRRDRGRRKTNKIFCSVRAFREFSLGFYVCECYEISLCDFCVLNLFVRMINDFMAFAISYVACYNICACHICENFITTQEKRLVL